MLLRIRVDDFVFSVRTKEAPGWTPSFSSEFPKSNLDNIVAHGLFEEDGNLHFMHNKE